MSNDQFVHKLTKNAFLAVLVPGKIGGVFSTFSVDGKTAWVDRRHMLANITRPTLAWVDAYTGNNSKQVLKIVSQENLGENTQNMLHRVRFQEDFLALMGPTYEGAVKLQHRVAIITPEGTIMEPMVAFPQHDGIQPKPGQVVWVRAASMYYPTDGGKPICYVDVLHVYKSLKWSDKPLEFNQFEFRYGTIESHEKAIPRS